MINYKYMWVAIPLFITYLLVKLYFYKGNIDQLLSHFFGPFFFWTGIIGVLLTLIKLTILISKSSSGICSSVTQRSSSSYKDPVGVCLAWLLASAVLLFIGFPEKL